STFHFRFSTGLQVVGTGCVSLLTPEPFGPRKRAQSEPNAELMAMLVKITLERAKQRKAFRRRSEEACITSHLPNSLIAAAEQLVERTIIGN
ncbi:MAG: hypothetical protein QGF59_14970, partial [Pirellulaceae bacterium]|nr:hypothetical protein [Pirellulaceae bacterium]